MERYVGRREGGREGRNVTKEEQRTVLEKEYILDTFSHLGNCFTAYNSSHEDWCPMIDVNYSTASFWDFIYTGSLCV